MTDHKRIIADALTNTSNLAVRYCPKCGVTLRPRGEYDNGMWWDHAEECGLIDRYGNHVKPTCICGFQFTTSVEASEHWREVDHDWVKLAVRSVLEDM